MVRGLPILFLFVAGGTTMAQEWRVNGWRALELSS